jgi:PmbA protein
MKADASPGGSRSGRQHVQRLALAAPGPLALAERALALLPGEGLAMVTDERSLLLRFARSEPTQATGVQDTTVQLLSVRDGHVGAATTNLATDEALRGAARRATAAAEAAARAAGAPGDHPGLPAPPAAYPAHEGFDAETAAVDPAAGGAALASAFAVAAEHHLEAFGVWTTGVVRTAIASSRGVRAVDEVTDVYLKVLCRDAAGRTGWDAAAGASAGAIDAEGVARRAAAKVSSVEPVVLGPGSYPVVLEPDAVGGLLDWLALLAFNGLAHAEGRGALAGRLGTPVAARTITLTDAPQDRRTLPRAFDFDGVPKRTVTLIRDGVAENVVHDLRSAARAGAGARSTGHALAPGGAADGPAPTNLVLSGGAAADAAELAAPIERGLYVTRLWYINAMDPKHTLLTGTTRDGTFLIEDGRITRPARDVRFTDSVLRILLETEALTAAQRLTSDGEFYGMRFAKGTVAPALRAAGFRITG